MFVYVLLGVGMLWLSGLSYWAWQQQGFFKQFTKGVSKKDLKASLQHLNKQIESNKAKQNEVRGEIEQLKSAAEGHFQKIGFIRFNPYSDTGGDQSFCLCLLNQKNDGIVITSLHSREQTRMYAKQVVTGGVVEGVLSKEEAEVIKIATKQ